MATGFLSLFFATFVLEDLALISGIALAAQGTMSARDAFLACFLGIAAGDLGIYFLGWLGRSFKGVADLRIFRNIKAKFSEVEKHSWLAAAIFGCRFIPGTRVVTYALAGFLRYSFLRFFIVTLASVFIWVWSAFFVANEARSFFKDHLAAAMLSCILLLFGLRYLANNLKTHWHRKIFVHSWRKWISFEFWPPWLFYLPIVPRYIYLSLKYRSFVLPFYANPFIEHAGLIGESKWDIYKHLGNNEFHLRTQLIQKSELRQQQILTLVAEKKFNFPFILKPDKGQRGFAVRVIKTPAELGLYLEVADFDLILQEYCNWQHEAGIFYVREPQNKTGQIFSITDKEFPFVTGNGESRLGQLILNDKRARIMAATYFARFRGEVNRVPVKGEKVYISTCGNHCQGAIFKNGAELNSPELLQTVETLVRQIPEFYFGRLDIRYLNQADLKNGINFKIVEINGAGSEATHIWDPQTRLIEAYRVLYAQWELLFKIGYQIKQKHLIQYRFNFLKFLTELLNLKQQEKKLAVSS